MPSRHRRNLSSVVSQKNVVDPATSSSPLDEYGSRALNSEGAEMESADRSFLEYGLTSAVQQVTTVMHANASTMTNSDSCHDWTGEHVVS